MKRAIRAVAFVAVLTMMAAMLPIAAATSTSSSRSSKGAASSSSSKGAASSRKASVPEWKTAYLNYMQGAFVVDPEINELNLFDFTGDGVPELMYCGGMLGMHTGINYDVMTVRNGKTTKLFDGSVQRFFKYKKTGEYLAVFHTGNYSGESFSSYRIAGNKVTEVLGFYSAGPNELGGSHYIVDGVKKTFKSIEERDKFRANSLIKSPEFTADQSKYEAVALKTLQLTNAANWTQAQTTISTFFDKYDGKSSGTAAKNSSANSWNKAFVQFLKTFKYDKFVMFDDNKHWGHYNDGSGRVSVVMAISFYDTDKDGVPEMILNEGKPNSEWEVVEYKLANGKVAAGKTYNFNYDNGDDEVSDIVPGKEIASFEVANEAQMQSVISWLEKQ